MFEKFNKIPRLRKEVIVTEKIDGTNAQIHIVAIGLVAPAPDATVYPTPIHTDMDRGLAIFAGSRSRYITPEADNFGFAQWVLDNADELYKLGPGRHYGEWWGSGIQRTYGLEEKRLSMFNPRWADQGPDCVGTVPVLGNLHGFCEDMLIETIMYDLNKHGSRAAPGFMEPEGIIVYHVGGNHMYKQTFDYDEGKWNDK